MHTFIHAFLMATDLLAMVSHQCSARKEAEPIGVNHLVTLRSASPMFNDKRSRHIPLFLAKCLILLFQLKTFILAFTRQKKNDGEQTECIYFKSFHSSTFLPFKLVYQPKSTR